VAGGEQEGLKAFLSGRLLLQGEAEREEARFKNCFGGNTVQ
jgi:hypothetical protein